MVYKHLSLIHILTVADPSKVEERAVTLGINDENYIEITSGLEAGETVLMESQTLSLIHICAEKVGTGHRVPPLGVWDDQRSSS